MLCIDFIHGFAVIKMRQFKPKLKVAIISFLSSLYKKKHPNSLGCFFLSKQGFEPLRQKAQISKRERVCACTSEPRAACSPRWLVADEQSAKHQAPSACTAKGVRFKAGSPQEFFVQRIFSRVQSHPSRMAFSCKTKTTRSRVVEKRLCR